MKEGAVSATIVRTPGGRRLRVAAQSADWTDYRVVVRGPGLDAEVTGALLAADWETAFFATPFDPREDAEAWAQVVSAALAGSVRRLPSLRLPFGGGGPRDLDALKPDPPAAAELPGADHFGTVARTRVRLPQGRWRVLTTSDDGVRVRVSTQDRPVIENWTWHGPTRDAGEFTVDAAAAADPSGIEIFVEHFELDGWAILELELERAEN